MIDQTLLPGGNFQASLQGKKFEIGFRGLTVLRRQQSWGKLRTCSQNVRNEVLKSNELHACRDPIIYKGVPFDPGNLLLKSREQTIKKQSAQQFSELTQSWESPVILLVKMEKPQSHQKDPTLKWGYSLRRKIAVTSHISLKSFTKIKLT